MANLGTDVAEWLLFCFPHGRIYQSYPDYSHANLPLVFLSRNIGE